jgi:hypothetical protein
MDDIEARIRELLLMARDLEQAAAGLRAEAPRLIRQEFALGRSARRTERRCGAHEAPSASD